MVQKRSGGGDLFEDVQSELIGSKERLAQGFGPDEMQEAIQSILGREKVGRAGTARLMTRGGGKFDPTAFSRATAGLTGGTQRAIGGLRASSARMSRQGLENYLKLYMQLYGTKSSADIAQQQMATQSQQQQFQNMLSIGQTAGSFF